MVRLQLLTSLLLLSICCRTGSFFIVSPMNQNLTAGETATLQCHYFLQTCQNVHWDGPAINSSRDSTQDSIDHMRGESILTINNIVKDDEGTYHCICDASPSPNLNPRISTLIVIRPPSFPDDEVILNQTFHRDMEATIICNAFHGDPPEQMIWIRHDNRLFNGINGYRIESNALIIGSISNSDAGIYKCGFDTNRGFFSVSITVNVITVETYLIPVILGELELNHDEPLNLTCTTNTVNINVDYVWSIPGGITVRNRSIYYSSGEFSGGLYTCLVQSNHEENRRTVIVTVNNRPDLIEIRLRTDTSEGNSFIFHEKLRDSLSDNAVSLQWKKYEIDQSKRLVEFGSRLTATVSGTSLDIILSNARLEDGGVYEVNISNSFGYDLVEITLIVTPEIETTIEFRISDQTCGWVKRNRETIATQVKTAISRMFCSTCKAVITLLQTEVECSSQEGEDVVLRVTFHSQDTLPKIDDVTVDVEGIEVLAVVCGPACNITTTSTPPIPIPTVNITSVVVGGVITVVVVLMVLALTLLAWKCRKRFCDNHRVAQQEDKQERGENLEAVVVQREIQDPNSPECIGYIHVPRTTQPVQPVTHADETPVTTIPYSEPHAPLNMPPAVIPAVVLQAPLPAVVPQAPLPQMSAVTSTSGKRPNKLYIRSNSYHGPTRTRTPPS